MSKESTVDSCWDLHEQANARGESSYLDPDSGYRVFTAHGLLQIGMCCGSGCRHCPFDHEKVKPGDRSMLVKNPAWLTTQDIPETGVDVLFWSGGKDSYLAYRQLVREAQRPVVLLTTFDVHSRVVAHQEIHVNSVAKQAEHLKVPIIGVPLYSDRSYEDQVSDGISLVGNVSRLVFGDLHLQEIREWRENIFGIVADRFNASLHFPLWHADYVELLEELEKSGVPCEVSAVTDAAEQLVAVGDDFNRDLHDRISSLIDGFGENGEFHTLAKVWEAR